MLVVVQENICFSKEYTHLRRAIDYSCCFIKIYNITMIVGTHYTVNIDFVFDFCLIFRGDRIYSILTVPA